MGDARAVAEHLNIPFEVLDCRERMERDVIAYFVDDLSSQVAYAESVCHVQYAFEVRVISWIMRSKAGLIIWLRDIMPRWSIPRRAVNCGGGTDAGKDQSYALFGMGVERLKHVLFPLGGLRKDQVRELAGQAALPVVHKSESQEICFIPDDDYVRFITARAPELIQPGVVMHVDGRELGEHGGVCGYTIGQRRGLGIALGDPAYVVRLDAAAECCDAGHA